MKRALLSLFLIFSFLCPPTYPHDDQPFLAVYCNLGWSPEWVMYNPDILCSAKDWSNFDGFLKLVKKKAHGRKIVIDLDCHGSDILALQKAQDDPKKGPNPSYLATMGYVVNHIESILKDESVLVLIECCYPINTYKLSIRNNPVKVQAGEGWENCDHIPLFPIITLNCNTVNWSPSVFVTYYHRFMNFIGDVREYERCENPPLFDACSPQSQSIKLILNLLYSLDWELYYRSHR